MRTSEAEAREGMSLPALIDACAPGDKWDLAAGVVGSDAGRRALFINHLTDARKEHRAAARYVKSWGMNVDGFPNLRRILKETAMVGLLRICARDHVITHSLADGEAEAIIRDYVRSRVAEGKTLEAVAAAWEVHFDAARHASTSGDGHAVEVALAAFDRATDALFRKKGVVTAAAAPSPDIEDATGVSGAGDASTVVPLAPASSDVAAEGDRAATTDDKSALQPPPMGASPRTLLPPPPAWLAGWDVVAAAGIPPLSLDEFGYVRMPALTGATPVTLLHRVTDVEAAAGVVHHRGRPGVAVKMGDEEVTLVGIDGEWTSPLVSLTAPADAAQRCAVFTISAGPHTWLLDMPALLAEAATDAALQRRLNAALTEMLVSDPHTHGGRRTLVLVYGGVADFTIIRRGAPFLTCLQAVRAATVAGWPLTNPSAGGGKARAAAASPITERERGCIEYLDLMALSQASTLKVSGGLAGLVAAVLCPSRGGLNKYWQMSNWMRRPLTNGQMEYAAMDALLLAPLALALTRLTPKSAAAAKATT